MNSKDVGDITTAKIIVALMQNGKKVSIPFGDNQRYDLIFEDIDGSFKRVQCKTGRIKDGKIVWNTASSQAHRGKGRTSYVGQVDFFAVYCHLLDKVYLVPIDGLGLVEGTLRVDQPKTTKQLDRIRWAKYYELD